MHLRGGKAEAVGVQHRLRHIGHQTGDLRVGRVRNRCGAGKQDGVAQAGDFQDGHAGSDTGRMWAEDTAAEGVLHRPLAVV